MPGATSGSGTMARLTMAEFREAGYAKLRNCSICQAGYGIRLHSTLAVITLNTSCACAQSEDKPADWDTVMRVVDLFGEDQKDG